MEQLLERPTPRRRRRKSRPPILGILLGALVVSGLLIGGAGLLRRTLAPTCKQPPENPDWITQAILPLNEYSRPGTPLDAVDGVVVHYVGNPGTTAAQNRSFFANLAASGETYASSHFVIGLEGEIIQCVPLDEVAYCSNSRNQDTISIECCHPDEDGQFNQATYDSLVKLVNWLMEYYELEPEVVIRHYDITGKECPLYYVKHPDKWEQFLDELQQ